MPFKTKTTKKIDDIVNPPIINLPLPWTQEPTTTTTTEEITTTTTTTIEITTTTTMP